MDSKLASKWFDHAKKNGYSFLIIAEDTVNSLQYPVYLDEDTFQARFHLYNGTNMQRIVAIFNIDEDKETQMAQRKPWNISLV